VLELFQSLRPVFVELEATVPINQAVQIKHLIEVCRKYTTKQSIQVRPLPKGVMTLDGLHLGGQKGVVFRRECSKCDAQSFDKTCPECQEQRFRTAKELVHCFDGPADKTKPGEAIFSIAGELLKRRLTADSSPSLYSEYYGKIAATELLMPYLARKATTDGFALSRAKQSDNFTAVAENFCVPEEVAKNAYSDDWMAYIKSIREAVGLPV
jgi:hypothetical protein